jgi:hypothetical protein
LAAVARELSFLDFAYPIRSLPMNLSIGTFLIVGLLSGGHSAGLPWTKFCGSADNPPRNMCCYAVTGTNIECREETVSNSSETRHILNELLRRAEEARKKVEHPASPKE